MRVTKRRGVVLVAVGCILAVVLAVAGPPDYEIVLTRPMTAGSTYRVSIEAEMVKDMKATVQGRIRDKRSDKFVTKIEASVHVLEIDRNSQPSKASVTIHECLKLENNIARPLINKGSVVLVSVRGGKDVFEIDGKEVGGEGRKALPMVISLGKGLATADETFGTSVRHKVGDSWQMNKSVAMDQILRNGQQVGEDDVEGAATLSEVVTVDGIECLRIASRMRMKDFKARMPAGVVIAESSMEVASLSLFPVDTTLGRMEDQMKSVVKIVSKVRKDQSVPVMTVVTRDTVDVKRKYSY